MGELGVNHFLFLSAALFIIGMMGVLIRRNILIIFMCVELMINAVNLFLQVFFTIMYSDLEWYVYHVFFKKSRSMNLYLHKLGASAYVTVRAVMFDKF